MKILENCSNCKEKNTIESIHYYDKEGKSKTDPIAFLICRNCFKLYRFERLPFRDDIQLLSIFIGSTDDIEYFEKIELKKGLVTCLYCSNSQADFSYEHIDSDGISYQMSKTKPCVVKLHTKNKIKKGNRKQVGYLCGFCRRVYFNNNKMKLQFNKHWAKFIQKLSNLHPRFNEKEVEKLQKLYEKRVSLRNELELRIKDKIKLEPLNPKEKEKLKSKLDDLEAQIRNTNHIELYSLGMYPTREMGL